MTDNTQPDSDRIITSSDILLHDAKTALMYEELRAAIDDGREGMTHADALAEIAAILAENIELRAQLSSSGFTAADMATAAAQGFRDGVASAAPLMGAAGDAWWQATIALEMLVAVGLVTQAKVDEAMSHAARITHPFSDKGVAHG